VFDLGELHAEPGPGRNRYRLRRGAGPGHGSGFTPDTEVTVDITVDGNPFATFPQMTDGSGGLTFGGEVPPEEIGLLVLTVTETNVCSDSITATILAGPPPTPEGLPDAAMAPTEPTSGESGWRWPPFCSPWWG
jgi:hypothetical protein